MSVTSRRRKRDYYEVLEVARRADEAELKRAYRDLARRYHPDINPGPDSEDRFKEINEAYAVLSDTKLRARYDRHGHAAVSGASEATAAGGFGTVVDAFDDLISDILRRRRGGKRRGRDLRYTLEIDLAEAAFGCQKLIRVPGVGANGAGAEREFSITVPPATKDGAVRRLRGEGEPGQQGGAAGDLHVIIRVREHPVLRRDGYDIWCEVPVSFPQAALGAVVEVPTLEGRVRMRVPEGTQSGRVMRMRGKGMPRGSSAGAVRGDQLVRVTVETPTALTSKQRELLERFAAEAGEESIGHPQQRGFLAKLRDIFRE